VDPTVAEKGAGAISNLVAVAGVSGTIAILTLVLFIVLAIKGKLPWGNKKAEKEESTKGESKRAGSGSALTLMGSMDDSMEAKLVKYINTKVGGVLKQVEDLKTRHEEDVRELRERHERETKELDTKIDDLKDECNRRLGGHHAGLTEVRSDIKGLKEDQIKTENQLEKHDEKFEKHEGVDDKMKSKLHRIELKVK